MGRGRVGATVRQNWELLGKTCLGGRGLWAVAVEWGRCILKEDDVPGRGKERKRRPQGLQSLPLSGSLPRRGRMWRGGLGA